jgi:hypothetical protein
MLIVSDIMSVISNVSLFRRSVGDLAVAHRHPGNSTRFLPLLLGKNYSTKLVAFMQRRNLTLPFDADEDDSLETLAAPEFFAALPSPIRVACARRT